MFLIDIPFKGCQGRSNRSSIVHAVSMTPHAFLIFLHIFTFRSCSKIFLCMQCQWHRMHRAWHHMHHACGINDTICIVHAVLMTPHAFSKIRISSRIRIYIRKGFSPLIRSPGRMFWWKKPRVEILVTLSL
jgi:hypothetical protein